MNLRGFTRLLHRAVHRDGAQEALLSQPHFAAALRRERLRADRSMSGFSLLTVTLTRHSEVALAEISRVLASRVRESAPRPPVLAPTRPGAGGAGAATGSAVCTKAATGETGRRHLGRGNGAAVGLAGDARGRRGDQAGFAGPDLLPAVARWFGGPAVLHLQV